MFYLDSSCSHATYESFAVPLRAPQMLSVIREKASELLKSIDMQDAPVEDEHVVGHGLKG